MRWFLLLLLVPTLAMGQGLNSSPPGISSGKVLASFPLSANGPVIEVEAYAVQVRAGVSVDWCAGQLSSWRYGWPCRKATAAKMLEAVT